MPTATNNFIAFVRGINVGGKCLVSMAKLRPALEHAGLATVQTYIQSGNILFASSEEDNAVLARIISQTITRVFGIEAQVVVVAASQWHDIVALAPDWWGKDSLWKHNVIIMIPPARALEVTQAIGDVKVGIEQVEAGQGVVYQSILTAGFSKSASSKLVSRPIYKQVTIRNYNTAKKLAELANEMLNSGMMSA